MQKRTDYTAWLAELKGRIQGAQIKALLKGNTELPLYCEPGERDSGKRESRIRCAEN